MSHSQVREFLFWEGDNVSCNTWYTFCDDRKEGGWEKDKCLLWSGGIVQRLWVQASRDTGYFSDLWNFSLSPIMGMTSSADGNGLGVLRSVHFLLSLVVHARFWPYLSQHKAPTKLSVVFLPASSMGKKHTWLSCHWQRKKHLQSKTH